jgi:hypothetical protein
MTEEDARQLCERRRAEQPDFRWTAQKRKDGDWAVVKLPGSGRIDPSTLSASLGPPAVVGDDPRPAIMRNIPPYGPGL